jgi:hypothetical protein
MKHYKDGGKMEQIPQEAQNMLQDRKEEMGRKKFEDMQRKENEAPKKGIKDLYDKARALFGVKPENKKAKGGKVGSASKRGDGCAVKGKTRGKFV